MDNKTNVINIAYCTDANYLEYVAVSIMSVIMNNPEQSLAFFVFVYDVSDEDIAKLQSTSNKIQVITIDKADIEKYNNDFAIKHLQSLNLYASGCAPFTSRQSRTFYLS
ncbi:lipopolysaccharide 1,3-galactosyltransferase [Citrobacter koseri]|uniref:Lipopolysaccharide 1,3-galactosyltransferase n=1 Tax=Citrobacter koseri TaxID=545 RepID=A0A2X2WHL4_CITKO|nr:lipopolysaccharide 1,3-galactosyltransferase [Citrobacter koseri]